MRAEGWDTVSELSRTLAHNDIDRASRGLGTRHCGRFAWAPTNEKELRLSPQLLPNSSPGRPVAWIARSPDLLTSRLAFRRARTHRRVRRVDADTAGRAGELRVGGRRRPVARAGRDLRDVRAGRV